MIFHKTLLREMTGTALATFLVLLGIVITTQLVRLLALVAGGSITSTSVIALLGFTLIGFLPTLLSLTLFIAVLMTLSRAYRDSEMVVWFSCGVSLTRWITPVLMFTLPLVLTIAALALGLSPWAAGKAEDGWATGRATGAVDDSSGLSTAGSDGRSLPTGGAEDGWTMLAAVGWVADRWAMDGATGRTDVTRGVSTSSTGGRSTDGRSPWGRCSRRVELSFCQLSVAAARCKSVRVWARGESSKDSLPQADRREAARGAARAGTTTEADGKDRVAGATAGARTRSPASVWRGARTRRPTSTDSCSAANPTRRILCPVAAARRDGTTLGEKAVCA